MGKKTLQLRQTAEPLDVVETAKCRGHVEFGDVDRGGEVKILLQLIKGKQRLSVRETRS